MKIGIISDTHGLLRPEVVDHLQGVEYIIHAGDILDKSIVASLEKIAPVYAVRGNCDAGLDTAIFPRTELIEIDKATMYLIHDINDLDITPQSAGVNVVVSGHTHRPAFLDKDGILYINPGSCGPRRFSLPISMAVMQLNHTSCQVHFHNLEKPELNLQYDAILKL